jgi:hypothetical protein
MGFDYEDIIKITSEQIEADVKKLDSSIVRQRLIDLNIDTLTINLMMTYPDKYNEIINLIVLIKRAVKSKFQVDLAILTEETYKEDEHFREFVDRLNGISNVKGGE